MKLAAVDQAIEVCGKHLRDTESGGTEIESFLTRYLLVLMCASFEEHIEALVKERADKSGDVALAAFACAAVDKLFRSVKTAEIAGLLGHFGSSYRDAFQARMRADERAATFFNNIVTNRHGTAHGGVASITFTELVGFYEQGHSVLDAVRETLMM